MSGWSALLVGGGAAVVLIGLLALSVRRAARHDLKLSEEELIQRDKDVAC